MPLYRFVSARPGADRDEVVTHVLYSDTPAIVRAMSDAFPDGCEVWQGLRFVGRFHGARTPSTGQARKLKSLGHP